MRATLQTCSVLTLALAVGTVVPLSWQQANAAGMPAAPGAASTTKPALTVTTVRPVRARLPITLRAEGNIAAWQEASVGVQANGLRLTGLHAGIGDVVRTGQLLASFDAAPVQADLALAQAQLQEAQAGVQEAAGNARRARALQDTGALSSQQIDQYLALEQTAQARVAAARAALDVQQLRLAQTRVLAPDSGVVSARSATLGAVVPAGSELFRLIRQGRLEWRAEVTAAELGRIKPGTAVVLGTAGATEVRGKVRLIAPTLNEQTRTALVYVDLPPMGRQATPLRPGMFARGTFELGASDALLVPQGALVLREGFSYVYAVGANARVARIKVQTGRLAGERIEITSALDPATPLVASGAAFLQDGDPVRVQETAPGAPAAQPGASAAAR